MNRRLRCLAVAAGLIAVTAGCEVFEDQTPEFINFRMNGTAGEVVNVIYSKQFVAGVNEEGITRVEVFGSDTVAHVLPIDTIIDVRLEQRLFLQAFPVVDTLRVDVDIDVDDRGLYDNNGLLYLIEPWKFLYQFNTRFSDDIEVVI
jgi:hypothetical protein